MTRATFKQRLLVEWNQGVAVCEDVEVRAAGSDVLELLRSPVTVKGIAAGDQFRLLGDSGSFVVTQRAGNIAIQIQCWADENDAAAALTDVLPQISGRIDGRLDRRIVVTVPGTVPLERITKTFNALSLRIGGMEWHIANRVAQTRAAVPSR